MFTENSAATESVRVGEKSSSRDSGSSDEQVISVPNLKHIAFIPDGNRRWAKQHSINTMLGHKSGYESIKKVVIALLKHKMKYVTFYCFSSENWGRAADEVSYLMGLLSNFFNESNDFLMENGIRVEVIGNLSRLSEGLQTKIRDTIERTKNNDTITVVCALSYSGRDEIVRAAKKIAKKVSDGELGIDEIDEKSFSSFLDSPSIPNPDIIVRTSERRISNFLLWQLAYSEIIFIDKYWPDVDEGDVEYILEDFSKRQRRYGK